MDWLEKKWEDIKRKIENAGLIRGLLYYLLIAVISAGILALLTRNICQSWIGVINFRNPSKAFYNDMGMLAVEFLYYNSFLTYVLIASFIAVWLFFKRKLYPATEALKESIGNLALGDYGHEITYRSGDELGRLCEETEYLRNRLIEERKKQWEEEEDQRSINAAFAHDIRTPLTVMKGYTEYLLKYIPKEKISEEILLEKLNTIATQQERLIAFTKTMTDIRQIEKRTVKGDWYKLSDLVENLRMEAETLTKTAGEMSCEVKVDEILEEEIFVDMEIFLEVFENLMHNALRYAQKRIEVCLKTEERRLILFVKDDGEGFSQKALRIGSKLYYSEEKENGEHFGMGLFLCRMLCEKHRGGLTLINSVEGGAIATAEFLCRCR